MKQKTKTRPAGSYLVRKENVYRQLDQAFDHMGPKKKKKKKKKDKG